MSEEPTATLHGAEIVDVQHGGISTNGRRYHLLSRDRLSVPLRNREVRYLKKLSEEQSQPLISINSDEEFPVDVYNTKFLSPLADDETVEILQLNGCTFDHETALETEYADLDLFPPHFLNKKSSVLTRIFCCKRSSCDLM